MPTQFPSEERICPACRKSRLSRYNPDPLCAACSRSARTADGRVPAWLWDSAPMRDALARTDMGAVLAILRSAVGLSQLDLANLVEGWSQTIVSRFETGQRQGIYDIREILRFADLVDMPREALLPLIFGRADVSIGGDDDAFAMTGADVERRTFNSMTAGLMIGAALPQVQVPPRVDKGHIRYLRGALKRIRDRDQTGGGGRLGRVS